MLKQEAALKEGGGRAPEDALRGMLKDSYFSTMRPPSPSRCATFVARWSTSILTEGALPPK